jgi:hypothetical protein
MVPVPVPIGQACHVVQDSLSKLVLRSWNLEIVDEPEDQKLNNMVGSLAVSINFGRCLPRLVVARY